MNRLYSSETNIVHSNLIAKALKDGYVMRNFKDIGKEIKEIKK